MTLTHQPLPRGRHALPRHFVVHNQRERLFDAMMRAVAEQGYPSTSVETVLRRAGISRLTFYQQFADKEDCFLQSYDAAVGQLMAIVLEAYDQPKRWAERICWGLDALLETLSNEDDLARMAMVEVLAAGPRAIARYSDAVTSFIPLFAAGRTETRYGRQLPPEAERVIVGGIASVIAHRVAAGEAKHLRELLPDLLSFALTPFIGSAHAARAADRARTAPAVRTRSSGSSLGVTPAAFHQGQGSDR